MNLMTKVTRNLIEAVAATCSTMGHTLTFAYIDISVDSIVTYMRTHFGLLQYDKYLDDMTDEELGIYIVQVYGDAWERILAALGVEYNPIYNVNEHTTEQHSGTDSRTLTSQSVTTTSNTSAGTKDTSTDFVVPYDSNTELEAGKNESTFAHTTTTTPSGVGTDNLSHGEKIEKDREGNIGFMSNQYLITEEIKLRMNNLFMPTMCTDIADLLTDGIWGDEE